MVATEIEIASLKLDDLIDRVIHTGDPEVRDEYGYTALMLAVVAKRMDIIYWLIGEGADIRAIAPELGGRENAIHYAIDCGATDAAWLLLERAGTAAEFDYFLNVACRREEKELPRQLIHRLIEEYRTSPTPETNERISKALRAVARCGRSDLILLLMDAGTDTDYATHYGAALTWAITHRQWETAQQLLERGAARQDHFSEKILYEAVLKHDRELTQFLLKNGVSPCSIQEEGYTPLIMAAAGRQGELVNLLLEHGADIHMQDNAGHTALWYANKKEFTKIAERLIAAGATEVVP